MNPAAVLQVLVTANTSQATAALTKTQTQLKATEAQAGRTSTAIGSKLGTAAKVGGAALGVGLVYGMAKAVKVGSEFEKQMDSLGAVTQASTKDMARFEKQALRLGQKTAYSASEAAAAQIELAKGGLAVKDILGGALPAALSLAAAGELELADAAATTVNAMQLFQIQGKKAGQVADILATAANKTTADVEDFAMALRQGGSAAQAAGYDLNQTMIVLEALAKAGIKNSDAGTSLKTAFLQLLAPTEKQKDAAEALNLEFVNQAGNLKNAAGLAKELQDALGGMSNAQRVAQLKTLAGTDGFRTLNALYEAGAGTLRDYSKANQEVGTAQDIARQKMDNLKGDVENLSGAMETIGIVIYQKVQPALRDMTQAAADAATAFGKLLQGKGNVPEWAKDLGDSFSALGRGLKGVWEDVILPIIRTLGPGFKDSLEAAARAVKGGVDIIAGILTLDLGRAWQGVKDLFGGVGGYFLSVFKGAVAVVAAPVKALAKALTGPIKTSLNALKTAVVFAFDKILGAVSTALGAIADAAGAFDWLPGVGGKLGDLADAAHEAQGGIDDFRDSMKGNEVEKAKANALGHVQDAFDALGDVAGVNEKRLDRAMDGMRSSLSGAIDKFKDFTDAGDKSLDKVGDASRDLGKRGSKNFDGLRKVVDNLEGAWSKGLDLIGGNTKNLLSKLKVQFDYDITKGGKSSPIDKSASFFQRGGPINMGAPSGDTVPAMLERGEYVLNRRAVAKLGKHNLDAINFNHAPRFQSGGIIEQALGPYDMGPIQYDPNHAGGNSHLHLDFYTQQQAIAIGKKMQGMGWNISEYSGPYGGFGGLTTTHQSPGHYDGTAFDANTAADETRAEVAAVVKLLGGGSGAMVDKIARVLLKGPKGPLRTGGQAALDRARAAANALIKKASASSVGGGVSVISGDGDVERIFAQVARKLSNSKTATLALGEAGYAESGMRDLPGGDSTSQGALQLLASTAAGLGVSPHDEGAIASLFFTRGFYGKGGANSLAAQGLAAHQVAQDVQGSGAGLASHGAANYLPQKGNALAWMRRYGLQRGGLVQKFGKGGGVGPGGGNKPGLKINPPKGMGLQITGPASFPGWSQANSAASLAAALTTKLNEIASLDETLSLEQMLADRDGVFTAAEIQSQIALNAKLLPVLTAARDIAKAGAATVFGGLSVAKGPNRAALIDMAPGFTDAITEMQGVTGKGGRIFETWMEIARLKSTAPDVPGARGSVLDAIEAQIALAGLTPELTDDIAGYTALVHYWETLLASLQSSGAPFGDIGSAASSLKSARDALAALTGTTDGGGSSSIESDLNALKLAQAMDTIRRLNVGIAQNSVFAGTFATGGTIPNGAWGIAGERGPEIIHGPATVHSNSDSQSMLSPEVRVVIEDNRTIVSVDGQVEAIVDNKLNQIARSRSYAGAGRL